MFNFVQVQGQFRRTAELDKSHFAHKGEGRRCPESTRKYSAKASLRANAGIHWVFRGLLSPTPAQSEASALTLSAIWAKGDVFQTSLGEMAELAEGARLLSECGVKAPPRVRIPLSPPSKPQKHEKLIFRAFVVSGFYKINLSRISGANLTSCLTINAQPRLYSENFTLFKDRICLDKHLHPYYILPF